ncbi:hypothetical protein B0H11DRAFT_437266 [Mycena galericulata]|nr:hypothetical protein B0H11DRAFT_437266 [Mycena galericulata]
MASRSVKRKAEEMDENKDTESSVLRPHQRNIQRNETAPSKAQAQASGAKKKQRGNSIVNDENLPPRTKSERSSVNSHRIGTPVPPARINVNSIPDTPVDPEYEREQERLGEALFQNRINNWAVEASIAALSGYKKREIIVAFLKKDAALTADLELSHANEEAAVQENQALKAALEESEARLKQSTADLKLAHAKEAVAVQEIQTMKAELEERESRLKKSAPHTADLNLSHANDEAALAQYEERITLLNTARLISNANEAKALQENHALKTGFAQYNAQYTEHTQQLNNQISYLKALLYFDGFEV